MARRLAAAAALVAVLVAVAVLAERTRVQADLTAGEALTLSDQTREVLGRVEAPVRITAFYARTDPARVEVPSLLSRYRRLNRRISFRVLDPTEAPAEARRLGVDPVFGGIAVALGADVEVAPTPTEQDITAALARLLRGERPPVCYATGHGQPSPADATDDGWSRAAALLADNGYGLEPVDLLRTAAIPPSCPALIVNNPTAPLGSAADAVAAWLAGGGRALVLTDPVADLDWEAVLAPYGVAVARGIVFEGDPDRRFPDDPTRPIVLDYASPSPIANRLPPTYYPGAQALVVGEDRPGEGLSVVAVARTTGDAYLETEPLTPRFDAGADRAGPVVLVAAADRSRATTGPAGRGVVRSRVVVTADADFSANAFVDDAGNGALLVRSLDWLTMDPDLVTVTAHIPAFRPLQLTEGRITYARFLLAGVVPALFLIGGAFTWVLRRTR